MIKFKPGDRVIVLTDIFSPYGAMLGDVGRIDEKNSTAPYVRFDHQSKRVCFPQEELRLVTGDESELEKLLIWNRVSK